MCVFGCHGTKMSLPDLILDATMSGDQLDARSKDSGVDSVKDGVSEDSGMMTLSQGSERKCTTSNGSSPVSTSCALRGSVPLAMEALP